MKKLLFLLPVLFMLLGQNQTLKAGDTTSVTVTDSVGKPVYEEIDSILRPMDQPNNQDNTYQSLRIL